MAKKLNWGILSTGRIAGVFAKALPASQTGKLVAVASRTAEKARDFAGQYGAPKHYGAYEELLADKDVQAVYVATPHPMHLEWAVKAAQAGKHILCEKPLAMNLAQAQKIVAAARKHDVFLMEAFMYRCHPQTAKLVELVRNRAIGEVKMIQASFGFCRAFDPESRLYAKRLGGGGILDVGCYPMSMTRLVAGAALGRDFADPIALSAHGHLGRSGIDERTAAVMKFDGDIVAQVSTAVSVRLENVVRVFGTEGMIEIPWPWAPAREGGTAQMLIHREGKDTPEEISVQTPLPLYAIEADTGAAGIENRQAAPPAMTWDDSLGNMKALDWWRREIGLAYEEDGERQGLGVGG